DFAGWQEIPERFQDRPFHAHNRLIKSSAFNEAERRETAREVASRLGEARAPVHVILPNQGIEEWDKPGGAAHDAEGLAAFLDEMRTVIKPPLEMSEIDAHINDQLFADTALKIFDDWVADGTVKT
ncbi:MAG: Tm-1-like ATP-binding domain-containing protein, partial [Hyphomicrobiales bacterium]